MNAYVYSFIGTGIVIGVTSWIYLGLTSGSVEENPSFLKEPSKLSPEQRKENERLMAHFKRAAGIKEDK